MACFKDWLISENFKNTYKSCVMDVLVERTCFDALKIILESEDDDIFTGDLDAEKFSGSDDAKPIAVSEPNTEPSEEEIKTREASTIRQMQKELKDAILVLRWNAVANRAQQVDQVKSFRDQYIRDYGNPFKENTEEDDEDEEFLKSMAKHGSVPKMAGKVSSNLQTKFDVMQTVPLLEKLGYINVEDLRSEGLEDDEIKNAVVQALFKASKEEGNDLPPDVEKFINPTELKKATDKFFLLTREIFKRTFKRIVNNQIMYVVGSKEGPQKAGKLYDPGYENSQIIDDIANRFSIKMLENFTTREVSRSTAKPEPWLVLKDRNKKSHGIGKEGLSDLESEEIVDTMMNYIRATLKRFPSNEQREAKLANSPSRASADLDVWGGNRDKKASMINDDIEKGNLEFYKKYIEASDQERESLDNRLRELVKKLKETKKLSKDEHDEKWRLEIIQQIFFLHSKHSESLSLDPNKIAETLAYFRSNFLGHKYRSESFFGAMGKKTGQDDGGRVADVLGFGGDSTARSGDSSSGRDRGSSSEPNPTAAASDNEMKRVLHGKLLNALNALRNSGSLDKSWASTPLRMGQLHALTICVFWDLGNCSPNGAITNLSAFSNLVLALNKDGSIRGETDKDGKIKTSCVDQLMQLRAASGYSGKDIKQVADEVGSILGKQPSEGTVRGWLTAGLEFICNYMQNSRLSGSFAPSRTSSIQSTPIAPPKQSKTTSTGRAKLVTDPVTGKKRFVVES